ncbi:hypothetical protein K3495_g16259, partial [Podosphaera aphanis]
HPRSKQHHSLTPTIWHPDTAASSHMTDNPKLFKGPLRPTRRTIRVGGGKLFCREMGDAWMVTKMGVAVLKDCLLVPGLGANLMSVRKSCATSGLKGYFDQEKMYLLEGNKTVLSASHENGVYCVDFILSADRNECAFNSQHVSPDNMNRSNQISDLANGDELMFENNYEDKTFISSPLTSQQLHNTPTVRSQDQPVWNKKEMIHKNRLQKFTLMHRRLGHVSSTAISKVHNVTTLKRPIIVPQMLPKCEVCVKANIKNRFSKRLSPHQAKRLAILSVDIAGPFPTSIRGNSYFAEVIDSWSRKVWIIPIAKKS